MKRFKFVVRKPNNEIMDMGISIDELRVGADNFVIMRLPSKNEETEKLAQTMNTYLQQQVNLGAIKGFMILYHPAEILDVMEIDAPYQNVDDLLFEVHAQNPGTTAQQFVMKNLKTNEVLPLVICDKDLIVRRSAVKTLKEIDDIIRSEE